MRVNSTKEDAKPNQNSGLKESKPTKKESASSLDDLDIGQLEDIIEEDRVDESFDTPVTGPKDVKTNALEGLNFVVSGIFDAISRDGLEKFIEEKGGKKTGAVSGKTNYLIIGHKMEDGREVSQGGKYKSAKAKNIPILTEQEFEKFIEKKTGLKNFSIGSRKDILNQIA